ncbi:MAG: acetyl-CoA carboxylase biotin carboxyl carrier protein subunit, partial [Acidimicrobiales bacterium]
LETVLDGVEAASRPAIVDRDRRLVSVNVAGHTHSFEVPTRSERWAPSIAERKGTGDAVVAPFPALVDQVLVEPGDTVEGDQVLVVLEAMKMLHSLTAPGESTIAEVRVTAGDQVASNQVLITFESEVDE